ncbi:hypothetical protein NQ318_009782 [Aromia moschata]|uniref:N-acetyltransferase domain-containing protein n=1 Tax=Aromia moschata TaxID=1265417 RepID=A0AAV8Y7P5_9CUCU|nr:hypothetical protein NQ318_009782 [Aromia moschata]
MSNCTEFTTVIRKAKKEDMIEVYELIKELAEFEKLEDQVKIDNTVLQRDGFDTDHPAFRCLVAEVSDGHIVGYALYFPTYSTWEGKALLLEDLYVRSAYRRRGIGKQLFMAVAKIAHESEISRLDFHVLSWNPAIAFYKGLGAVDLTVKEDWHFFRLDQACLKKLFFLKNPLNAK